MPLALRAPRRPCRHRRPCACSLRRRAALLTLPPPPRFPFGQRTLPATQQQPQQQRLQQRPQTGSSSMQIWSGGDEAGSAWPPARRRPLQPPAPSPRCGPRLSGAVVEVRWAPATHQQQRQRLRHQQMSAPCASATLLTLRLPRAGRAAAAPAAAAPAACIQTTLLTCDGALLAFAILLSLHPPKACTTRTPHSLRAAPLSQHAWRSRWPGGGRPLLRLNPRQRTTTTRLPLRRRRRRQQRLTAARATTAHTAASRCCL